jgi:hypothetical protein
MIAAHRRRIEKNDREKIFVISNAADFPKDSPVDRISGEIDLRVADFLARDNLLVSSFGGKLQAREVKGDTRDFLIAHLRDIVTGAAAIGDEAVPGITAKYTMPYPRTGQNLIATADAWFAETAPYEHLFVAAGFDADFRNKLNNARNDFQKACAAADGSAEEHDKAFETIDALMRDIMNLTRRRSALIRLKYKNNPGKLASWLIASHLELPPKKKVNIVMQMI